MIIQQTAGFFKFLFLVSLKNVAAKLLFTAASNACCLRTPEILQKLRYAFEYDILVSYFPASLLKQGALIKSDQSICRKGELMQEQASFFSSQRTDCHLCPRQCHVNRLQTVGFCKSPNKIYAARAALHHWEEPCISGINGSGTVFFSGCTLRCCFCQNHEISLEQMGKPLTIQQLSDCFLRLQQQGAHNINLVTPTQYLPWIIPALDRVRHRLTIPVVYNCGGYECPETVSALADYVDIWLPDLKYKSSALSSRYSMAPDYFEAASKAIIQMIRQTKTLAFHTVLSDRGPVSVMDRGVILRHLVLPGQKQDSIELLKWIAQTLPKDAFLISLMSQYTPYRRLPFRELNRRITTYEYDCVVNTALELGLEHGYMQKKSSAREEYRPPFDFEGLT